ncbi:MAG TPA: hypothetical protein VHF86_09935, partial [Xanthomonadaceae bacterium]|nr:hypothetical protein [Xanthomonadaceae bacterium]
MGRFECRRIRPGAESAGGTERLRHGRTPPIRFLAREVGGHRPKGKRLGTNVITRSETGCWIVEQWRGAGGFSGTSVNAWDAPHQRWRQ